LATVSGVAPTVSEGFPRRRRIAITPATPNVMAATMMSTHAQAGRPPPDADEPAGVAVAVTVVVGVLVVVVVVDELLACDATAAPAAPAATAAPLWREAVDVVVTVLVLVLVFVFVLVTVFVLVFVLVCVLVFVLVTVVVCGAVAFVLVVVLALAAAALVVLELVAGVELDFVLLVSEAVAVWVRAVIVPDALSDLETLEATLRLPPVPQPPATSAHAPISAATATRCVPLRRTTNVRIGPRRVPG